MYFDMIFRNGLVVDGTGRTAFAADVGVTEDKIAAVGNLSAATAGRDIDISRLTIAPGFIDMHTHADVYVLDNPSIQGKTRQGVTTDVIGNCGFSPFPAGPERRDMVRDRIGQILKSKARWSWNSLDEYCERLSEHGIGLNLVPLVGHTTMRVMVMGLDERNPTPEEFEKMRRLLADAMEQGAFGFSTGLTYSPASCSETQEIIDLSRIASKYGRFYATHSRLWAGWHKKAVEEAVKIGKQAGLPVQISHQTIIDSRQWGKGEEIVKIMEKARHDGVDVTFDVYPYTAGASPLCQHLPGWVQAGGLEPMLARLRDSELRKKLHQELAGGYFGGLPWNWDSIFISKAEAEQYREWSGKSIAELATALKIDPIEAMLRLIEDTGNRVDIVIFNKSEEDVSYFIAHPLAMVGSDSYYTSSQGGSKPHPRNHGTFPRVLGQYVRERKLLSLEQAIYKMTGFPAQRLGLHNRGRIGCDLAADVVVFDPATVIDRATYARPQEVPVGIVYVAVNGALVLDGGQCTGKLPGRVLRYA